ncbi:MAG: DMT family transporter [Alphaproteobacteria bacterium]
MSRKLELMAYGYLALTMSFWAGNAIVGRMFRDDLPPITLAFIRWFCAFLLILIIFRPPLIRDWPVMKANWKIMLITGTFGIGIFNTLQYISLQYTTAINVGLMQVLMPMTILLLDVLFFSVRVGLIQITGMLCATCGVVVILSQGNFDILTQLEFNFGDLTMLTAVMLYSIFAVALRLKPAVHQWSFLAAIFAIGAIELFPFLLFEWFQGSSLNITQSSLLGISYVVIGPAILAYLFFTKGVETLGPNRAGMFFYFIPLVTAALSVLILGEPVETFHLVGFVLTALGLRLALQRTHA